ncbi:MAG: Tad domain-containing protein [Chloroflexi bacterium]|nr:Tad domain-containing protein [Chloroflexota bacterium]
MKPVNQTERGQALALIAVSVVVLLGFAALAIDGGMLYSDRRHAQNAADASALAAGGMASLAMDNGLTYYGEFACGPSLNYIAIEAINTAISRAYSNDYVIDADISDHHGVLVNCVEDSSGVGFTDRYLDIIVDITRITNTSLVHFVYNGPAQNEVEAVARLRPRTPLGFGNAIVALNDADCLGNQNGLVFSGSSHTEILGGGIYSNGCLYGNGSQFSITVDGGGGTVYAGVAEGTLSNISPEPEEGVQELPEWVTDLPAPNCDDLPDKGSHVGPGDISPGVYSTISLHNGVLNLDDGLYCLTGGPTAFSANGGEIYGDEVTIYVINGGVSINGNVDPVKLSAPLWNPPVCIGESCAITGLLFYLGAGNTSDFKLIGNSDSLYIGTIFAPDADIYISGDSGTNPTFNTQIIGFNVEISGNAVVDIEFKRGYNVGLSPRFDLQK